MSFTQRNYPRVDINAPVVLTVENQLLPDARCINISMGGMCIDVVASLAQQQKGEVEFSYESDEGTVLFKGEFVVRLKKKISTRTKKKFNSACSLPFMIFRICLTLPGSLSLN